MVFIKVTNAPMHATFFVLAIILSGILSNQAQASRTFPKPASLEPNVRFWTRVYTKIDRSAGYLHDTNNLNITYEVMRFQPKQKRRKRLHQTNKRIKFYQAILTKLARGKRKGLSKTEQRVLKLWPKNVSNRTLKHAIHNIRLQLGQSDKFRAGIVRSGKWENYIRQTLRRMRLPIELAALPFVESSYNPKAYSHVGAAGMWQFTRPTGRRFLRVDHIADERLDPFKSTLAAAQLLKHNHSVTEHWPLAITAYNHGLAGIRRAIRTANSHDIGRIAHTYKGARFGFASRNFYASFLAALHVANNSKRYFGPLKKHRSVHHHVIKVPAYVTIATLQRSLHLNKTTLRKLNPALQKPIWNNSKLVPKGYALRIPRTLSTKRAKRLLAAIPARKRFNRQKPDRFYTVRAGDSLSRIAAHYRLGVRELVAFNNLKNQHRIRIGQVIRIPTYNTHHTPAANKVAATKKSQGNRKKTAKTRIYRVRAGDTVAKIARKFRLTPADLIAINSIANKHKIKIGQKLRISKMRPQPQIAKPVSPPVNALASTLLVAANGKSYADSPANENVIVAPSDSSTPLDLATPDEKPESGSITSDNTVAIITPDLTKTKTLAKDKDSQLLATITPTTLPAATPPQDQADEAKADEDASFNTFANQILEPAANTTTNTDISVAETESTLADPSDYSIAADDSIEIQATETLGHYAEWLGLRARDLRRINRLQFTTKLVIGNRLRLKFSKADKKSFLQHRINHHRDLQESYFERFKIVDTQTHIAKRGDSLWILSTRTYSLPIWLLRQYNPDYNFDTMLPGHKIIIPNVDQRQG